MFKKKQFQHNADGSVTDIDSGLYLEYPAGNPNLPNFRNPPSVPDKSIKTICIPEGEVLRKINILKTIQTRIGNLNKSKVLKHNHSTVRESDVTIKGNMNKIIGDNNKVIGNFNTIIGNNNFADGNFNKMKGDGNSSKGNFNK